MSIAHSLNSPASQEKTPETLVPASREKTPETLVLLD